VTSVFGMFQFAKEFNQKLCHWNFDNLGYNQDEWMFRGTKCSIKSAPTKQAVCQPCN